MFHDETFIFISIFWLTLKRQNQNKRFDENDFLFKICLTKNNQFSKNEERQNL